MSDRSKLRRPGQGDRTGSISRRRSGGSPPGKSSPLQRRYAGVIPSALQMKSGAAPVVGPNDVRSVAAKGVEGAPSSLPHAERIQASFCEHDVSAIGAHTGGDAMAAIDAIGAEAYATGGQVAFRGQPDLHTAAHEAAHVVQQRSWVQLKDGVGQVGDVFEREADHVADLVVQGQSAAPVLDKYGAGSSPGAALQLKQGKTTSKGKGKGKGNKSKSAVSKPKATEASADLCADLLRIAELSTVSYTSALGLATVLLDVVNTVLKLETTHKNVQEEYKKEVKEYEQAGRVSDFDIVLGTLVGLVDLGTSVHGFYSGVKTLLENADEAGEVWDSAKDLAEHGLGEEPSIASHAWGAGNTLGGDAVDMVGNTADVQGSAAELGIGGASGDPAKDLINRVQVGVVESNEALRRLANVDVAFKFEAVKTPADLGQAHMKGLVGRLRALKKDRTAIPAGERAMIAAESARAKEAAVAYTEKVEEVRQIWCAYQAGGHEGLTDSKDRSFFDLVARWVREGDPRVKALHVAVDEENTGYVFDSQVYVDTIKVPSMPGFERKQPKTKPNDPVERWFCHGYSTHRQQNPRGMLYVTDSSVFKDLAPFLDKKGAFDFKVGAAEKGLSKRYPDAMKGKCSVSIAKALDAIGVDSFTTRAQAQFLVGAGDITSIEWAHSGDWSARWWESPAFVEFWRSELGGKWGYLYDKYEGKRREFTAGASLKAESHKMPLEDRL